jgi:hypothetical protein
VADDANRDREDAARERQRLARERHELERARHELEMRTRLVDQALQNLEAREAAVQAAECELLKRARRRVVEGVVTPELPDAGPSHLRPDPSKAQTPDDFLGLLRAFHMWKGRRSLRDIAAASGDRISSSTVRNILRGTTPLDRLEVVRDFVVGCGGNTRDLEDITCAWRHVYVTPVDNYMTPVDSTLTDLPPFQRGLQ